jgi:two-component system CheB/CheR fusion protein
LRLWALQDRKLVGQNLQESELLTRCKELTSRLESTFQPGHPTVRFECTVPVPEKSEDRVLSVTIKPILSEGGKGRAGTLLYVEDVSPRHRLQHTIEELETTGEELQSTNEELETTNEELQSANEELETTNEELQSTNEELETTNEELQALNEELGTTNEELEVRTRELDDMNALHSETLERIPWPVMLVGEDLTLQVWNPAVQKLFGLGSRSIIGLTLSQLPVDSALRARLVRHHQNVIASNKPSRIPAFQLKTASFKGVVDVKFTPLLHLEKRKGVLIVMEMSKDGSNGSASPRNVLPRVVEKKLSANGKRNGGTNSKQNAKKSLKPRKK